MVELPEARVLADQIGETIVGKTIEEAVANANPHGFAWYTDNPADYNQKLAGKTVASANDGAHYTCGGNVEILCGDMLLIISTPIKYHPPGAKLPARHQLLLRFTDGSHMSCTVQMWGAMLCFPQNAVRLPNGFYVRKAPNPLDGGFDLPYFLSLFEGLKPNLSAKAFLATEQRVPGLGNGVLQDILFHAGVHPKRPIATLDADDRARLHRSVVDTLTQMYQGGGRDTEKNLHGKPGGYRTVLSRKTLPYPCRVCGSGFVRQAYLGGNIYFCPTCQPLEG